MQEIINRRILHFAFIVPAQPLSTAKTFFFDDRAHKLEELLLPNKTLAGIAATNYHKIQNYHNVITCDDYHCTSFI